MKSKLIFGVMLFFSLFAAKSAVCQSTYTEGYNRGYGLGRSNTVSSVQTLTNDYVQAENGDLVGYAQGLLDGFNAGVLKGPIINPKITVSAGGGAATFDETGYSNWLFDEVSDGLAGSNILVVDID